jgi:hypothetical protein
LPISFFDTPRHRGGLATVPLVLPDAAAGSTSGVGSGAGVAALRAIATGGADTVVLGGGAIGSADAAAASSFTRSF